MNILEYQRYQEKISWKPFISIYHICARSLDFSYVPIHWHDEMELIYIKKGHGIITVDFTQYQVSAGTLALIIPGQLHSIEQYENESMEYENIIFHPQILLSKQTDTCSTDYFSPLMDGTLTVPVLYQPGDPYYGKISACVDANDEISKTNPPAYQLFIKSQLFMLFYILFNKCSSRNAQKKDYKSLEKMKLILKFVENNYMEKITIEDVAKEVSLSQSHFMKYFKNTMGTSFIDYLNEYRLTMASRLLISSDSSVLDIAAEVGFDNLSYFNRSCKKRFQQTPREYRKRYAQPELRSSYHIIANNSAHDPYQRTSSDILWLMHSDQHAHDAKKQTDDPEHYPCSRMLVKNRHCDNENRKYMPAWKCFSFCVFFQHRRHVKFFIRPGRIDDFPDNGKSHKGHCRNKYCAPEPWIFVRKQHKKIERIHAEYKCCQHMVQTRHTVRPFRIAPKRLCNFYILFFCHGKNHILPRHCFINAFPKSS